MNGETVPFDLKLNKSADNSSPEKSLKALSMNGQDNIFDTNPCPSQVFISALSDSV